MNTKITLFAAVFLLFYANAIFSQPVLTGTGINPQIGESYNKNMDSWIDPGSSGASQTWDLSSLSGSPVGLTNYTNPASTTYGSYFPNANMAATISTTTIYTYNSNSVQQNYGMAAGTTKIPYSDPEDMLRFPFTYNDSYIDTWSAQFDNAGYTYYRSGTTTVTADGYGTLITPNGTYTDVLRVHFYQDYQDSLDYGGPYLIYYENDEYMWYKEGVHAPIAYVFEFSSSMGSPSSVSSYITGDFGIESNNEQIESLQISPNPASNFINISFESTNTEINEVRIFNLFGQQVDIIRTPNTSSGTNTIQIAVSDLTEGIYFAQIIFDNNSITAQRFTISR